MKTRVIVFMLAVVLALSLSASVAASGPPWPAQVITPKDGLCWVTWGRWVDGGLTLYDTLGKGSYVYVPRTGGWNARCNGLIDFNDPSVLTIEEACSLFSDVASCSHSTFILRNTLECLGDFDITTDTNYVVNPSGHATLVCHFNPD